MFAHGYFPAGYFAPGYYPPVPAALTTDTESGRWQPLRKTKKRTIRIKRSDFAAQEQYAQAIALALQENDTHIQKFTKQETVIVYDPVYDDDDILLTILMRTLH